MGSFRLKDMTPDAPDAPKLLTLPERVEALEAEVQRIKQVREVERGLYLIASCEENARARREHEARYVAAAPQRLARLREFIAAKVVRHAALSCSASEFWVGWNEWFRRQVLPAGAIALESFPDALVLQSAAIEALGDSVAHGMNGISGIAIVPDGKTTESFIAEIEAAEAERQRLANAESERLQNIRDLGRAKADAETAATQARVNRQLADAHAAEQYRAAHPDPDQRPNASDPAERARQHELERRQAAAQPA
jgi:hypothetical protein